MARPNRNMVAYCGAHIKNLRKIQRSGMKEFLNGKRHW